MHKLSEYHESQVMRLLPNNVTPEQLAEAKQTLMEMAVERFGPDITPCPLDGDFKNSYYVRDGILMMWYNSPDDSTRMAKLSLLA